MMRMLGPGAAVVVAGGRMMRILRPGWSGGSGGARGVGRLLPCRLFWLAGGWGRVRLFSAPLALVGPEVVGVSGAWDSKKGCVACWLGSRSGVSTGVYMVVFAWLRVRSASLRTFSGGSQAMAVRPGCRRKGGGGGSSSWPWPA